MRDMLLIPLVWLALVLGLIWAMDQHRYTTPPAEPPECQGLPGACDFADPPAPTITVPPYYGGQP